MTKPIDSAILEDTITFLREHCGDDVDDVRLERDQLIEALQEVLDA